MGTRLDLRDKNFYDWVHLFSCQITRLCAQPQSQPLTHNKQTSYNILTILTLRHIPIAILFPDIYCRRWWTSCWSGTRMPTTSAPCTTPSLPRRKRRDFHLLETDPGNVRQRLIWSSPHLGIAHCQRIGERDRISLA
jgi:hypothetical protein